MSFRINDYEIDVEKPGTTLSHDSEVTEYPVDEGADKADHVIVKPMRLSVSGVVSNTPFGSLKERREQFITVDGESFALPADEADAVLRAIKERREPVVVECSRGTFEKMVLKNYTPTSDTYDQLSFSAEFVQIDTVANDRVTIRVEARPKKRKLGHKPSLEAPQQCAAPNTTTQAAVDGVPEALRP